LANSHVYFQHTHIASGRHGEQPIAIATAATPWVAPSAAFGQIESIRGTAEPSCSAADSLQCDLSTWGAQKESVNKSGSSLLVWDRPEKQETPKKAAKVSKAIVLRRS